MTEATLDKENAAMLEEMLRNAKPAQVESELARNPIISKGTDGDAPVPMVGRVISSAGYVWVYETRTFEKAPCLYYMLPQILRQRRPDGSYRWTTNDPGQKPVRGTLKCMLHSEGPNRPEYDRMGFRVCPKSNLTNEYQLRIHMIKKHPQEWKAIDEAQKKAEADEDRQLRRLLIQSQLPKALKSDKFLCDVCQADFGSQITLDKHKLTHGG